MPGESFPARTRQIATHLGELPPEAEALNHGHPEDLRTKQSTEEELFKKQLLGKVAGRTF